ncbi:DUF1002 domain-containing protein [Clostridium perfringens]|uniref:DUF1002 domain-containing protein n=1 Tax=Clostridium perfringens TaxID=1502 RepID=UPI000D7130BC|nr:DUF1002 domain-containing protein [Clostridium perfringens]MBI6010014.1 DUF1002 domain-containing protein [Clostridium perfringens]MBO3323419.1 DUF1002 domain-containing protein [Clostridium perfringens]MBO3332493.1 DUF1002 domain-containing protein [Clostridium perfringens]MDC4245743.1 DUF1002 domain-containing protein [Clostridium perfringens]MDK0760859.1 DUF1002 domain-containing protein [Clostridium perfringens]
MKKNKLITAMILAGAISIGSFTTVFADTKEVVTLGANLNSTQKQEMFKEFGVKPNDVKVITMNVNEIREQLGLPKIVGEFKGNAYSSAFVKLEEKGYGIKVKTNNLTEVTKTMLSNALLTSGVTDADVIATAPFPVTGTSALAGVLQAFEKATGENIPVENKEVARQELSITNNLAKAKNSEGQDIGRDGASAIVNQAKEEVIKDKPKNDKEVGEIVNNITNNYNIKLTPTQEQELVGLLANINSLGLDYSNLKAELDNISNNIQEVLKENGQELKESGTLDRILNKILGVCTDIKNWFISHFGDGEVTINGVTYDKDGNMINKDQLNNIGNSANDEIKDSSSETKNNIDDKSQSSDSNEKSVDKANSNKKEDSNSEGEQKNKSNSSQNNESNKESQNNDAKDSKESQNSKSKNSVSKSKSNLNKSNSGSSSNSKDKSKETIKLEDGTVIPKYNSKGEEYNPVTGGYGHMQETEDAGKDSDQTIDYIIVDGKKVPLHDEQGREYNPETGRYGDPDDN